MGQGKERRIELRANRPGRTTTHSLKEKNSLMGEHERDSIIEMIMGGLFEAVKLKQKITRSYPSKEVWAGEEELPRHVQRP